jgi:hypothetical protein
MDENTHLSFTQGGGHGGSHPHLVHEFVSALVDDRDPYPNAVQSANWTCVGICAHESALKGGAIVKLPAFTLASPSRRLARREARQTRKQSRIQAKNTRRAARAAKPKRRAK